MANQKQYGLILPKKNQLSAPKAGNVFGNDDDSEEEEGTDWVKKALKAENEKNKIKKQTKLNMQKALKENPTIFQYDEVYDEIERTKEEGKPCKKVLQKPKYIENLLKSADLRKKEQELRKDRMIQKEIEAEDALYPDKERYVTSSYKAKLEEMKKFEKEQENQDRLEAIGDVTKQRDISGFYRHLYRQTIDKNDADLGIAPKITKPTPEEIKKRDNYLEMQPDIDKDDSINSDSEESSKSDNENIKDSSKTSFITKMKKKRQYRKKVDDISEPESDEEIEKDKKDKIEKLNVETIKDETIETKSKKQKLDDNTENKICEDNKLLEDNTLNKKRESSEKTVETSTKSSDGPTESEEKSKPEVKKKINIWEKRTVGEVFDAALERYLIRKRERLAGS